MPVYKDKRNGKWRYEKKLTLPDGRRQRIYGTPAIQTKAGAQAAERAHIESVLRGEHCKKRKEPIKYAALVKKFMKVCEAKNKPSEVASKERIFRIHLLPAFGDLKLDQISYGRIEDYTVEKKKTLAPKTVNNHLTVLRCSLDNAVKRGLLEAVPRFEWLKVPPKKREFYGFEDAEALLQAAEEEWKPMIALGLKSGLRHGEMLALKWENVDFRTREIHVRASAYMGTLQSPKNNRFRTVPMTNRVYQLLRAHQHLKGPFVFCDADGNMLSKHQCKWPMFRACDKAGLPRKSWHILRHTFASHLAMRGKPIIAIKELLGHQTIEMTMKYAHLLPNTHRDAISVLDSQPKAGHEPDKKPASG